MEIKREVVHIMIQQVRKPGVRFLSSQKWSTWMTKWCVDLLYPLPTPGIFSLGIEVRLTHPVSGSCILSFQLSELELRHKSMRGHRKRLTYFLNDRHRNIYLLSPSFKYKPCHIPHKYRCLSKEIPYKAPHTLKYTRLY